jgi:hypothetical protein
MYECEHFMESKGAGVTTGATSGSYSLGVFFFVLCMSLGLLLVLCI